MFLKLISVNSLLFTLKQSKSLNAFKSNLCSFDLTKFLKGSAFIICRKLFYCYCLRAYRKIYLHDCILRRPIACILLYNKFTFLFMHFYANSKFKQIMVPINKNNICCILSVMWSHYITCKLYKVGNN